MSFRPHLIALGAVLSALAPAAAQAQTWEPVPRADLRVTEGSVLSDPAQSLFNGPVLRTRSAAMRAVERDHGHHAAWARLAFHLLGDSATTAPLGSGEVRTQIGLKLRAKNPCNLVYVMWRRRPTRAIVVSVKRNPGQTTSSECGNRGYSTVATLGLPLTPDHRSHVLVARTRRTGSGALALSVYADGTLVRRQTLSAALTAGLEGPIGVRSDNGDYRFALAAAARS